MRGSKWNQLAQPLLAFLFATGFLFGVRAGRLVFSCGLRPRGRLLDLIHLRRCWCWRCSFRRGRRILAARRFLIGAWRARTCSHGLHSNARVRLDAIDLVGQIVDHRGCAGDRLFLQVGLADFGCRRYVWMLFEVAGHSGHQLQSFTACFFGFALRQCFRRGHRDRGFQRFQSPFCVGNAVRCRIPGNDFRISLNGFLLKLRYQLFFLRFRELLLPAVRWLLFHTACPARRALRPLRSRADRSP